MGQSVNLYSYDKKKLVQRLVEKTSIASDEDIELLNKILDEFGSTIGDRYVILENNFWEEYDCYYELGFAIDEAFGCKNSMDFYMDVTEELGIEELVSAKDHYTALHDTGVYTDDY